MVLYFRLSSLCCSRLQMYRNKAPTVADAETHACCWASVKLFGSWPRPRGMKVKVLVFGNYSECSADVHLRAIERGGGRPGAKLVSLGSLDGPRLG